MGKFTKEEQLDLFSDLFGSQELVEAYIRSGQEFCEEAQAKLFDLAAPNNEDMVSLYAEIGHCFSAKNEVKLFDLPHAELVLETYCFGKLNVLEQPAQMRLLAEYERMPKFVKRYIRAYKKTSYLCDSFITRAQTMGLMK